MVWSSSREITFPVKCLGGLTAVLKTIMFPFCEVFFSFSFYLIFIVTNQGDFRKWIRYKPPWSPSWPTNCLRYWPKIHLLWLVAVCKTQVVCQVETPRERRKACWIPEADACLVNLWTHNTIHRLPCNSQAGLCHALILHVFSDPSVVI